MRNNILLQSLQKAESILSTPGIPASSAINMFYKQIILQRGLHVLPVDNQLNLHTKQ